MNKKEKLREKRSNRRKQRREEERNKKNTPMCALMDDVHSTEQIAQKTIDANSAKIISLQKDSAFAIKARTFCLAGILVSILMLLVFKVQKNGDNGIATAFCLASAVLCFVFAVGWTFLREVCRRRLLYICNSGRH